VERTRRPTVLLDLSGFRTSGLGACSVMFAFSAAARDVLRYTITGPAFSF